MNSRKLASGSSPTREKPNDMAIPAMNSSATMPRLRRTSGPRCTAETAPPGDPTARASTLNGIAHLLLDGLEHPSHSEDERDYLKAPEQHSS